MWEKFEVSMETRVVTDTQDLTGSHNGSNARSAVQETDRRKKADHTGTLASGDPRSLASVHLSEVVRHPAIRAKR